MTLTPLEIAISENRMFVFWYGMTLAVCMTLCGFIYDIVEAKLKKGRERK